MGVLMLKFRQMSLIVNYRAKRLARHYEQGEGKGGKLQTESGKWLFMDIYILKFDFYLNARK